MNPGAHSDRSEPFRALLTHQVFYEGRHVAFVLIRNSGGFPGLAEVELPTGFLAQESLSVRRLLDGRLELAMGEAA